MTAAHATADDGRCYCVDCVTERAQQVARRTDRGIRSLALAWNHAAAGLTPDDAAAAHVEDWHRPCESDDCDLEVCLQVPFDGDHGAAPCCEHGYCEDHRSECRDCCIDDRADIRW